MKRSKNAIIPNPLSSLCGWLSFFMLAAAPLGSPLRLMAAFEEQLWGARPAALAGSFAAVSDDANAPVYNPAGISLLESSDVTFMYAQLYTGTSIYAGEGTTKLSLGYFGYSPVIKNKQFGSYAIGWNNFRASQLYREDTFTLTWADAYQFESLPDVPVLSYGVNLKLLRHDYTTDSRSSSDPVFRGGTSERAVGVDVGFLLRPHFHRLPGFRIGLVAQNVNEPDVGLLETDRVPRRYVIALAYRDPKYPAFGPSIDISRRDGKTLVSGGWEAGLVNNQLMLRAGGNEDELGAGLGWIFKITEKFNLRFDYGLLWPLNLDGTNGSHRVSVSTSF